MASREGKAIRGNRGLLLLSVAELWRLRLKVDIQTSPKASPAEAGQEILLRVMHGRTAYCGNL